jgi:hypothetical protein
MKYHITMTEYSDTGYPRVWYTGQVTDSPPLDLGRGERPYFQLDMCVISEDEELKKRYREAIAAHKAVIVMPDSICSAQ